jgi:hypothetical protein
MPTRLVVVLAALATASCFGTPEAGDPCGKTGFLCADEAYALECRSEVWVKLPCRGANGCKRTDEQIISCDMSGNVAGDPCASSAEGRGMCTTAGTATLECRDGVLVETNTCVSCSVSAGRVICRSN